MIEPTDRMVNLAADMLPGLGIRVAGDLPSAMRQLLRVMLVGVELDYELVPRRTPRREPLIHLATAGDGHVLIKPTDEMEQAFNSAAAAARTMSRHEGYATHDGIAAVLRIVERDHLAEARRLLMYALHLRMYGECAPGGTETWAQFDRDVEAYLRRSNGSPS